MREALGGVEDRLGKLLGRVEGGGRRKCRLEGDGRLALNIISKSYFQLLTFESPVTLKGRGGSLPKATISLLLHQYE